LLAKTIFASPVLTAENTGFSTNWQKLANPANSQFVIDNFS